MSGDAWPSIQRNHHGQLLRPPAIGGSVQVVNSTTGELGGDDRLENRKSGAPLNQQMDDDIGEEAK